MLFSRVQTWGSLIKFSHSLFALPFALIMLLAVSRVYSVTGLQVALLVVCVVCARAAAMTFNRIVDISYDALNERTRGRELPSGKVSSLEAYCLLAVACFVFVVSSFFLGFHCGVLAVPVLVVLLGYSFMKRFSSLCHFVLGLALALAPGGVWYAITATWSWKPVSLMVAVLLWVAGFDILYACQDLEFDRQRGLWSVPAKLGVARSRALALVLHASALVALCWFGCDFEMGRGFWCGVAVFGVLIASQHAAIARRGIACIDQVFFTRNGIASVVLLVLSALDFW